MSDNNEDCWPLRLSQIHSILVRNLDGRILPANTKGANGSLSASSVAVEATTPTRPSNSAASISIAQNHPDPHSRLAESAKSPSIDTTRGEHLSRSSETTPTLSVSDCFCEIHVTDEHSTGLVEMNPYYTGDLCKKTLNPRWIMPQEEPARLSMAKVQHFDLRVYRKATGIDAPPSSSADSGKATCLIEVSIDVLKLVPLKITLKTLKNMFGLPLNTVLFEAYGGALYALPSVVSKLLHDGAKRSSSASPKRAEVSTSSSMAFLSQKREHALDNLHNKVLRSGYATSVLRRAHAYQRTLDNVNKATLDAMKGAHEEHTKYVNTKGVALEGAFIKRALKLRRRQAYLARQESLLHRERRRTQRFDALVSDRAQTLQSVLKSLEEVRGSQLAGAQVTPEGNEHENKKIQDEGFNLRARQRQLSFLVNARQVKLMSELHKIYPIAKLSGGSTAPLVAGGARRVRRVSAFKEKIVDDQVSTVHGQSGQTISAKRGPNAKRNRNQRITNQLLSIRGLILPMRDMLSHEEEQVSTALGYVAHLVHLLSKIFQIVLRYEMVPGGSRSRIRDYLPSKTQADYLEYPLFWRGVSAPNITFTSSFINFCRNLFSLLIAWLCPNDSPCLVDIMRFVSLTIFSGPNIKV